MRRTALTLALALASALLVAAPASAASYAVTASLSKSAPDVGTKTTLSGKVTGSGAGKKTLTVELRLGNGSWKKVGTTKTSSKGAYSYGFKVTKVGDQALRVVAPKKGKTGKGTSPAVALAGWTWLDLARQPHAVDGSAFVDTTPTISGDAHPKSVELQARAGGSSIFWSLANQCDDAEIDLTLYDGAAGTESVTVGTDDGAQSYPVVAFNTYGTHNVTSQSEYVSVTRDASGPIVVITSPRAHCKVDRLPASSN